MKKIWCPETATKGYLDTLKSMKYAEDYSGAPEFISATAGGWKARFIVEVWSTITGAVAKSLALAIAAHHSGGRHICIVANEKARQEYISGMQSKGGPGVAELLPEVVVGRAEEVVERLKGVDFLVIDGGSEEYSSGRIFGRAVFGHLGAVVVVLGNGKKRVSRVLLSEEINVVKSRFLPVGNGLEVVCIGAEKSGKKKNSWRLLSDTKPKPKPKAWFRHIDEDSGEEHIFRR